MEDLYQHDVVLNHIFMISLYSLSEVKKLEKSYCKKNECKAGSVLTSVQLFDSLIVRLLAQMQNNQERKKINRSPLVCTCWSNHGMDFLL